MIPEKSCKSLGEKPKKMPPRKKREKCKQNAKNANQTRDQLDKHDFGKKKCKT
jgi:hypothetical protein